MAGTSITQKLKMLMEVGLDSKSKIVLKNELTQVLLDAHAQANSDLKKADTLFADLAVAVNSAFKKMGKPEFLLDIENLMGKKNKWSVLANSITNNFVDALDGLGAKSKQLGDDFAANMTKAIDIVGANLDTLVKQLNTIITKIGSTGQGINTSKYVKSIDQIDAAVNRIGKTSNRVQKLLQFDSAIDNIEELHKALDKIYLEQKASDFATLPWEDQYKLKTKFMEGYRQYEKLISNQNTKHKHRLDKDLTGLYNELLPAEHDMKNMLLNVQNRIDGKRLVGYENTGNQPWAKESTLKDIKNILESGIKVKDTDKKPTKASNDTKPKAAKATTENKSKYHAMGRSDATKYITDHYDYDLWEDWYTRSDGKAREKIAELLKNDQKLRNAALNQMWDDYKKKTGSDVAFEEFLNTPIPMYRGVGKHSATDGVLSFSLNKKTAMANAEDAASVIEILMKPIETLGNARPLIGPSSEAEVMIAPEQLASYKDQEKVLVTYQKLNEEVEQYCKLKRQVIAHQNKGADIDQFIPLLRAGEDTIAKHFDVNNPEPTLSRDGIKMMLQAYPAGGVGIDTMLNTMAKSLGIEVPQASQKAEDSLEELNTRFTETQEKIKQTTKIISNQKEWLEYLGTVLDDKNFATSGKKQATEQLRDATHKLISYRRDPEQYKSYQYAEEMKMVAWQKAYDEAQKQGVASSTLTKYYTDALGSGKALKTLQDENDRRLKTLHQYEDQLARLKQTADQTKASIDAFNTSLSGKQSAKDSKEIANLKQIVDGAAGRDNVHGQTLTSVAQVAPDTDQKTTIAAAIGTQVAQDSTLQEISTKIDNIKAADNSTLESVLQEVKGVLEQIQLNTKSAVADVDSPSESVEDARLVEIDQQLKAIDIQLEKMPDSARRITNEEYVGLVSQRQALEASKLNLDDVSSSKDSYALESTLQAVKSVLEQNGSGVTKIIDAINEMVKTIGESGVKHATSSQSKGDNAVTSSSTVSSKNTETFSTKIKRLHNMYAAVGKFSAQIEGDPNNNVAEAKLNNTKELIKLKEKELGLDQEQLGVLHKELAATEQLAKEQEAKIVEAKHKQRDYQQQVKESRDQARVNRANSMLNTGRNTLDSLFQINDDSIDFGAIEAAHKLSVALETLEQTRNRINQKGGLVDPQDAELLRAQTSEVQKYNTAVKQLVNNYTAVTSDHSEVVQGLQYQDTNSLVDMERQLRAAAMAATDGKIKIKSFDHANKSVTGTVKTGAHEMTDYTIAVRDLGNAFVKTAGKTHRAETFLEASKRKLSQISSYFSAMSVIGKASRSIKQGIQYIREIDSALTELRKVTDETEKTYDKFLDTAAKTADKVGSTIKDVVSSTADWARLGYSMQEAAKLAESTQILMNVSEFTDVNQATDSLISSIQAFKYTAEESMDVVDILNTIGNNYAISTADLAQSLTKSSGSLVAANGTLEEAVALTAAANTIIQDADVVGTALKTVAMRLRGTSAEEMEAEGLDTEGVVSQSKLRSKVKALSGVDILTQTGDYKSTYEILSEIADVWEDINDMDQAHLLELLAGKRAGSVMSAILNNPDTLKDAFESANDAAGSALRENEKYLDSIQGRMDLFTNAVQTMWNNTLDDDVIKWFIDLGTKLVKLVDNVGLLKAAFIGLGTFAMMKYNPFGILDNGAKSLEQMQAKAKKLTDEWMADPGNAKKKAKADAANAAVKTKEEQEIKAETQAIKENTAAKQENDAVTKQATATETIETQQTTANTAATQQDTGVTKQNTQENQSNAQSNQQVANTEATATQQKVVNTAATQQDTNATKQNTITNNKNALSWKNLGAKLKSAGTTMKSLAKSMLTMYAITTVFELIGKGIKAISDKIHENSDSLKRAEERFTELNSELSNTKSELRSLESELDTVQSQIDELLDKDSLSFTDQEELARLKEQSDELERQISLQKTLQKSLQGQTNAASLDAARKYMDQTSFGSKESKTERQEKAAEDGKSIGQAAGLVLGGILGAILAPFTGGASIAVGAGLGALIGGGAGKAIGSAVVGDQYDKEQSVAEALASMQTQRNELIAKQNEAYANNDAEAYKEASEALNDYDSMLAQHMSKIQELYQAMDWETATEDEREWMVKQADYLDAYNIMMGGQNAKSNAFSRIFGDEASDQLKDVKKRMEEAAEAGNEISLADAFNGDIEAYNAFKDRLNGINLTVHEAKLYFEDQKRAADDAINTIETYDAIKQIRSLTGGVNDLKNAFKELHEEGLVSAETLLGLEAVFGKTKGWDEFFETMSSGTATMEEAEAKAKNLAENYVDGLLSSGEYSAKKYIAYISHLQSLGVTNAKDFLDMKLKKNMVTDIAQMVKDGAAESDVISEIEKEYGIKLDGENDRLLLEKAITAEKQKQIAADVTSGKLAYDTAVAKKELAEAELSNAQAALEAEKQKGHYEKRQMTQAELSAAGWKRRNGVWYTDSGGVSESTPMITEWVVDGDIQGAQEAVDAAEAELDSIQIPAKVTHADVTNANNMAKEAANNLQAELDAYGLTLEISLVDKNELIDEAQNIYDTLVDAQKEYDETGYVSVDTLQSLLQLEPKYIALLYDENGKLNLNKESMYQLTVARVTDMGVQQAQQVIETARNALLSGNIEKLKELTQVTYGQADANWALVTSNLALLKQEMADAGIDDSIYNGVESQVLAIKDLTNTTIANIHNSLSSSGNTAAAETEDAFKKAMDYWENRIGANQSKYEQIQNDIDLLEQQGKMAGKGYYQEQINLENQRLQLLQAQKAEAKSFLDTYARGSDEWWEAANTLNDIESEIDDVTMSVQELGDAMAQVHWDIFDEAHERIGNLTGQLETVRDLLSADEDSFFNNEGEWTERGVAVLGTYIQEIEIYKNALNDVNAELGKLKLSDFDSEQEYYDKLTELTEQQHDYTKAISDSEQSVIDMYESQVDAIEEYTSTLVDSYNDYIDVVKEALDAERDLYDFKKNVQKQTKDIASLERRIASLSGSTNAADIAERRKLEAELYDAKEGLSDTYYEHSMDSQQEALDAEAEAYSKTLEKYVEALREKLDVATENMTQFMNDVSNAVLLSAETIKTEYTNTGVALDAAIVDPWTKAMEKVAEFQGEKGLGLMNAWTTQTGVFGTFQINATNQLKSPFEAGKSAMTEFANTVKQSMDGVYNTIQTNVVGATSELDKIKESYNNINDTNIQSPNNGSGNSGSSYNAADGNSMPTEDVVKLQKVLNSVFNAGLKVDGNYGPATLAAVKAAQRVIGGVSVDGYYGPATESKMRDYIKNTWQKNNNGSSKIGQGIQEMLKILPTSYYAKGTFGTKQSGFAITDESWIGEEITLAAGKNGQLQYLKKGSAVMPADISANLVEWGKLNPNMMSLNGTPNINLISNAVNKPELNLSFDALVKADRIDEGTLPEVKRFVQQEINSLVKKMNYALKTTGGR